MLTQEVVEANLLSPNSEHEISLETQVSPQCLSPIIESTSEKEVKSPEFVRGCPESVRGCPESVRGCPNTEAMVVDSPLPLAPSFNANETFQVSPLNKVTISEESESVGND